MLFCRIFGIFLIIGLVHSAENSGTEDAESREQSDVDVNAKSSSPDDKLPPSENREGKIFPFLPLFNHEHIVRALANKVDRLPERPCVLDNGTMIANGVYFREFCDICVCSDGKILEPPPPTYSKECPDDFSIEPGLGCVKYVSEEVTWCEARRRCFDMGADLVSLDGDARLISNEPFLDFQTSGSNRDEQAWVGLTRTTSELWHWTIGGGITHFESHIWGPVDPNGPGQWQCARTIASSYLLGDRKCDDPNEPDGGLFNYICEVPGFG